MKYMMIAFLLLFTYLLFLVVIAYLYDSKKNIQYRLSQITVTYQDAEGMEVLNKRSFRSRVLLPFAYSFKKILKRAAPKDMKERMELKLQKAGNPFGLHGNGWFAILLFFYLVLPTILIILIGLSQSAAKTKLLLILIGIFVCLLFPSVVLNGRTQRRRERMTHELPDILDLLTVSVEAGMSFDGALARIVEGSKGELIIEFREMLKEIQLGKNRKDALTDLAKRCDIGDISNFVTSFIQADQMGVSIGRLLRIQSEQVRDKRRQRAREHAMKAPVKIMIPMVFFIFPTIFVVILGPAVIMIINMLSKR